MLTSLKRHPSWRAGQWGILLWGTEREPIQMETPAGICLLRGCSGRSRSRDSRTGSNAMPYQRVRGRGSSLARPALVRTPPACSAVDLKPVIAALTKLDDSQLCALLDTTNSIPRIVPDLLTWIGHACDWELNRRADVDFPLQPPDSTIPPEYTAASIAAAMTLRARFGRDDGKDTRAVAALFDAVIRMLTGGARRH
jgi:hypothetical protein